MTYRDEAKIKRWRVYAREMKTLKDRRKVEEEKGKSETERVLLGCGLPGSNFHILPIATPKSLIV